MTRSRLTAWLAIAVALATLAAEVLVVGRAWRLLSAGLTRAAGDWLLVSSAIAVVSLAIGLWLLLANPQVSPGDRKV